MSDTRRAEVIPHQTGNTLFIINPAGHGGTGTTTWERFQALWPHPIGPEHAIVTERPGHAREIALSAVGFDTLAAVGGDGTVADIMSGLLDRPGNKPKLAIVPAGTGNDIARNTGIGSTEDAVNALRKGRLRAFDVIRVDYQHLISRESFEPGHELFQVPSPSTIREVTVVKARVTIVIQQPLLLTGKPLGLPGNGLSES